MNTMIQISPDSSITITLLTYELVRYLHEIEQEILQNGLNSFSRRHQLLTGLSEIVFSEKLIKVVLTSLVMERGVS